MKEINYRFYDGHYQSISVTDEVADMFKQLNRENWRMRKRIVRHESKISLPQMSKDIGFDLPDNESSPEEKIIEKENENEYLKKLRKGMATLAAEQKYLLIEIYIKKKLLKEIAFDFGVTYQAIQNRHKKILLKLKKFFQ